MVYAVVASFSLPSTSGFMHAPPPTACPSVQQLHSEMEEMYMLLNASRQQYDARLQLVHRHTADAQRWLSSMHDKYGWVSQLSNSTVGQRGVFAVIEVRGYTV